MKKIIVLIIEIALIALVIYGAITFINGVSLADDEQYRTAPWCVTEFKQGRGW